MRSVNLDRGKTRAGAAAALLFLCALCASPLTLHGAKIHHAAGSTSAAFLKLGVGARAVGMGGAFVAVPGDPYAVYWNPAGLSSLQREKNLGFFHNDHFQGLKQEFLLYTAPAEGLTFLKRPELRSGVWGMGLDYFYTPKDMERRSGANESDPLSPISRSEGKFGAYDLALSAAYGWRPRPDIGLGFAVKAIRQSIDTKTAASAALDLGLIKEFAWLGGRFSAGAAVQNIGPGIKFIARRYDLPLIFKAGLSARVPGNGALLVLEADKPVDNYQSFILGAEYPLISRLALRAGYRYRHAGNELGAWSGFSAGAGIAFGSVSFGYAFSPFGVLGNSHRFSLEARLGRGGADRRKVFVKEAPRPDGGMRNARRLSYRVASKAVMISRRGVKYEIKAASADSALCAFSFVGMLRGPAPEELPVVAGELPQELLARMPSGILPGGAWQFFPAAGEVLGDISLDFRVPLQDGIPGPYSVLYLAGNEWRRTHPAAVREEDGYLHFSVSVPLSTHYVLVTDRAGEDKGYGWD